MTVLTYDHSFDGFLSCVFAVYEQKLKEVKIIPEHKVTATFFEEQEYIVTNEIHANRLWKGIKSGGGNTASQSIYRAFLSELDQVEHILLNYIRKLFATGMPITNYADQDVLKISKIVKMVQREKHRMDAFVRFRETKEGIYFATIEPDFNVLPLNATHFKNRYADQKWLIYDLKRKYGLYYNLHTVETVRLDLEMGINQSSKTSLFFSEKEQQFEVLWQNYFKSTNIKSRKNMKLHLQHVPRRYWKYLNEKQPS